MTTTTKLDPRIKRTRQLLQQALVELLKKQSFQSITVQDIATHAELNRATFYAHFEDKYALLNYNVRQTFQAQLDSNLPKNPSLTLENVRQLTLTTCGYLQSFIGHCTPAPSDDQSILFIQVQSQIHEVLLGWLAEKHRTPEVIAEVMSWAIFGAVFQWARLGQNIPAEQLTEQILTVLVNGLGSYL